MADERRLERLCFEQKVFVEAGRKDDFRAVGLSVICAIHIVHDVIIAILETAQLHKSIPMPGKKRVIHFSVFTNCMRFGAIESNVVQIAQIFSARQHLFFVQPDPFFEKLLPFRSKVGFFMF